MAGSRPALKWGNRPLHGSAISSRWGAGSPAQGFSRVEGGEALVLGCSRHGTLGVQTHFPDSWEAAQERRRWGLGPVFLLFCLVFAFEAQSPHPWHADLNYQQAVTSHVSSNLWGEEARERLKVSVPCYSPWKVEIKCAKGSKCPSHVHWPEDGVVEETVLILDVANPPYSWGCRGKGFGQESHPDPHFDTMSQPPWLWGRNEENNHYCVIPSCWGATKKQSYGLSSSTE